MNVYLFNVWSSIICIYEYILSICTSTKLRKLPIFRVSTVNIVNFRYHNFEFIHTDECHFDAVKGEYISVQKLLDIDDSFLADFNLLIQFFYCLFTPIV